MMRMESEEMKLRWLYCKNTESSLYRYGYRIKCKSETEGLDASQIVLSSSQVTLKEGQMTSEEITATVDPTIFASIMEKQVSLSVSQSVM